jgi:16S rRNA (guanine527-N7)-methyltransferase
MTPLPTELVFEPARILARSDLTKQLASYYEALRSENRKLNLVSRETIAAGLEILAAESLLPLRQIERAEFSSYLDIGSGGGLPAIPILMARAIDRATLLERTSKKCLALERILRMLGLDRQRIQVEQVSLEHWETSAEYDLITMRLVKLQRKILRKIAASLASGGYFVYYAGTDDSAVEGLLTSLSYCYKVGNPPLTKHFTIFQKNH